MSVYANGDPVKGKKKKKNRKPPPGPGPGASGYNPYLGYGTSFNWGGRSWGVNDQGAFASWLGPKRYAQWLRNHPGAAHVFNPVDQDIYGQTAPQIQAIEYERKQREAFNQRRMHDLAGFSAALQGMLGEIEPAVRGAYGEGAETMGAGGTGYGAVLNANNAANAAQGNSLLSVLGAPEGAMIQGGDAGGVLAGLAGWVPETLMNAQGKAYGDEAAYLPKGANFAAQLEMRSLLKEATADDDEFGQQIKDVIAGIPSLRQDAQDRRTAQNMAQLEFQMKKLESERDFWLKKQALYISQGRLDLAKQAEKRATAIENRMRNESAGRDAFGEPLPGYHTDPKTGMLIPPGYVVDKNGNVVRPSSGKGGGKGGGLTPGQQQDALKTIDSSKETIGKDIAAAIKAEFTESPTGPYRNEMQRRRKIASAIFKKYVYLATFPAAKKRLRAIVTELMRSGGGQSTGSDFWSS